MLVLLLASAFTLSPHAIVDVSTARQVSLRWRPATVAVEDEIWVDTDAARRFVTARLALERATHACLGMHKEHDLNVFVLKCEDEEHSVLTVLWGPQSRMCKEVVIRELQSWYAHSLPGIKLVAKLSYPEDTHGG